MGWPEGWERQDIGDSPGGTDGKQHVWIESGQVKSYETVNVPVKVIAILLAVVDDQPESAMHPAWIITWTESERGWGQRPDGASLHLTKEDGAAYVKNYWAEEKVRNDAAGGGTPDEYERPDSEGTRVLVSTDLLARVKAGKDGNGIRVWPRSEVHALVQSGDLER